MIDTLATDEPCLQLKGITVPLTMLELRFFDSAAFEQQLEEKIRQAPEFFKNMPLVLGLDKFEQGAGDVDFFQIIGICRRHNIHIVAVRGGDDDIRRLALNAALAWLPADQGRPSPAREKAAARDEAPDRTVPPAEEPAGTKTAPAAAVPTKVVSQPVRSGQQIYAAEGDLILLAPVSAGAEVLAAGNIHAYSVLRGRALAGVHGNTEARIFCRSLEAELVSIAGHYKISEDLQESCWKQPAQVQLTDEVLTVKPLD
ncbi:septum site-determining protein MinC [Hydrocarboniclastica marina]|uniref:Probable septum site-determining protein MinC n=1 Tax=Hydrocarboniclastica marina TaxID=2259620 RepID=A0A4P7XGE6_9ALTE|nr:septum site-determining protein MinC [Hydrocarboniclastica marina]QCF25252.1 septum site-determining protein MinC [Hydrocarboniclastica marina]